MIEDVDRCYRAVQSRDPRFDGWFVTAVTSTGIYCRPSCPARTPRQDNVRFYPTAAAAQGAGYRACLRCRPDAAPGSPEWNVRQDVVARAMRLIADGVVDRDGVGGLAARLGYGARHLHRLVVAEVGAGPLALARTQRAHAARVLIETTDLPMADVAFGAGFASVRQFNETLRAAFGRTPTALRHRTRSTGPGSAAHHAAPGALTLRLPYRSPMALTELLDFLCRRVVPGVERAVDGTFGRTLRLPHGQGVVTLGDGGDHVRASLLLQDLRDLSAAVAACRRLFDLDADPEAVDAVLQQDPLLEPLVRRVPGRRVPGAVDGFELAVRAIVGQQVSCAGAATVSARLAEAAGPRLAIGPLAAQDDTEGGPTTAPADAGSAVRAPARDARERIFPSPEELLDAPDTAFAMPASRRRALRALATEVADGRITIDAGTDPEELRDRLLALAGIGEWTATYVVMRALGDPDAFVAGDLGVRRALQKAGEPAGPKAAAARSARWRPWRAYATVQLWAMDAAPSTTRSPTATATTATQEDAA